MIFDSISNHLFTFHNVSINSGSSLGLSILLQLFTFHNVSINSDMPGITNDFGQIYLHSTMFLLIPPAESPKEGTIVKFTFHNVSINSGRGNPFYAV